MQLRISQSDSDLTSIRCFFAYNSNLPNEFFTVTFKVQDDSLGEDSVTLMYNAITNPVKSAIAFLQNSEDLLVWTGTFDLHHDVDIIYLNAGQKRPIKGYLYEHTAWRQAYLIDRKQIDSLAKDIPKLFPFSLTVAPYNERISKLLADN